MQLYELTTITNEDGSNIVRVCGRIADRPDRDEQKEWIEFQFSIDTQTIRNGAILRQEVLEKAHEILFQLAKNFGRLGHQVSS